ncbi:MAG: toprim domain-containing protein [Gammaproteobacteria bacterium]|nr:toprim domain-containing protein [Gammaproteobacteria bacterium]
MACASMTKGRLLVPVRDSSGRLMSLQRIGPDGEKRFFYGGHVAGGYFIIGAPGDTVCIAEGYATAASIHEATGHAVAVAFNAGNLPASGAPCARSSHREADRLRRRRLEHAAKPDARRRARRRRPLAHCSRCRTSGPTDRRRVRLQRYGGAPRR